MNEEVRNAFYAGFFDADGAVQIVNRKNPALNCTVSQVVPKVLYGFASVYGGSVAEHPPRNLKDRPLFRWSIKSLEADQFLRAIQPYLIVKSKRCELALAFRDLFHGEFRLARGTSCQTPQHKEKREAVFAKRRMLMEEMQYLNQRGLHNVTQAIDSTDTAKTPELLPPKSPTP